MARYLVVGGVAGGATAAARLRRNDEDAEIVLYERGAQVSYASCGMPYYIGGVISDRDTLLVQTPERLRAVFNIDVRCNCEVRAIDRQAQSLEVCALADGSVYRDHYDKLVLAPGAEPVRPPLPGIDGPGVFSLRTLADADRMMACLEHDRPARALVVGAGYIGLEMAENLRRRGLAVQLVEMRNQVMPPLDFEMAAHVCQHLCEKGVGLYLNSVVQAIAHNADELVVQLRDGRALTTDMVLLSIGVRPDSSLAQQAGLEVSDTGAIVVDQYLATSDPAIYAVGDAVAFPCPLTGIPATTYLAGPATRQGRIAADNITGGNQRIYRGAINTAVAQVFDLTVACSGLSEQHLRDRGVACASVVIDAQSHAGYYPGASPMTIKTVFAPDDGRVLGAQAVGYAGVDKRIDLLAAVIRRGGTIYDLQAIEHGYAPPYSSVRDPVNIAGVAAENILEGRIQVVTWDRVATQDAVLVDVRTPEEYALGTIDGAINIPLADLRRRFDEIPRDTAVVVFCRVGHRGYLAARILQQRGFERVYNLSGGFKLYETAVAAQQADDFEPTTVAPPPSAGRTAVRTVEVDASGLQCPGPIMRLKSAIERLAPGDRLAIRATDPGFVQDARSWCSVTGNRLVSLDQTGATVQAVIEKGGVAAGGAATARTADGKTIIVFSDDLDRALASFVIANGAASMGRSVTMFFTFWGLSVIKRRDKPVVAKDLMGRMFGWMLPSDSLALKLSKMHMAGIGSWLMRRRMAAKGIDSLEQLIRTAVQNGVEIVACQMSMEVMGVSAEELIGAARVGGVATYLEKAEQSSVNLFI